ncbi:MAG: peptidase S14, partial [Oscillospiraceae bacterium]|nr:peptidase S14 [Oscillospiraceae bacterium]
FQKMQDRIIDFVIKNSNMSEQSFRRYLMNTDELVMDIGTALEGEKAGEEGLIDELGGLNDAIECLYSLIEEQKN